MSTMPKPVGNIKYEADVKKNPLGISWQDNGFIPHLNLSNVVTYFAGSPFYDKQCNNEILAMQGRPVTPENLGKMIGIEYVLLHCQEPILYVIRKQQRHGPNQNQVTPLANYYIVAGVVYQAPDLFSVINSRLLSCTVHLQKALDETLSASKFTPDKGYHWDFGGVSTDSSTSSSHKGSRSQQEDTTSSTAFQRQYLDAHLTELTRRHFQKTSTSSTLGGPAAVGGSSLKPQSTTSTTTMVTSTSTSVTSTTSTASTSLTTANTNVPVKLEHQHMDEVNVNMKRPRLTYQ